MKGEGKNVVARDGSKLKWMPLRLAILETRARDAMMLLLRRPLPLRRLTLHRYLSGLRFSTDASLNGQRLNIVFLGGDEFSGLVLERLEAAHGTLLWTCTYE